MTYYLLRDISDFCERLAEIQSPSPISLLNPTRNNQLKTRHFDRFRENFKQSTPQASPHILNIFILKCIILCVNIFVLIKNFKITNQISIKLSKSERILLPFASVSKWQH